MATKTLELQDPTSTPETIVVDIRGARFTFRELEIGEYDRLFKAATHEEADDQGVMQDITDSTLLLRLMVPKACIDPKLTPEVVAAMPMRMYRAIANVVNELHYAVEPVKQIKDDAAPAEETPSGND